MAYVNIPINGINCCQVVNMSIIENRSIPVIHGSVNSNIDTTNATNLADLTVGDHLFNDGKIKMTISTIADNARQADVYCNDVLTITVRVFYPSYVTESYLFACVDDENQIGCIGYYEYNHVSQVWAYTYLNGIVYNNTNNYTLNVYDALQTVTYTWQSVPSISGKNGISQPLSSHLDINDGEPITTSDTTKYSLNSNSNINKLVQDKLNS